jgi:hypothetical protein
MQAPKKSQNSQQKRRLSQEDVKDFLRTDRAILIICISIAFIFWLLTKLSCSYKDSVIIKLDYKIPNNKVFTNPPAQQLEVNIEGVGWDLLGLAFSDETRKVSILVKENEIRTISASSLNNKVLKYLPEVKILSIFPENIQLQTENLATKTIPVVLEEQIRLASQCQFVDSIRISPRTIKISGPASVIRDIYEWKTNVLIPSDDVDKDIDVELTLATHSNSNITPSVNIIRCFAAVEAVTEKQVLVQIEVLNAPDSLLLVILPKKIKVSCNVGMSAYASLNASNFKAVVNFEKVNLFNQSTIRVILSEKPTFVKQVQYLPKKVDYIIRSKNLQ